MLIGAQFNQNLFAPELVNIHGHVIPGTQAAKTSIADLEQKLTVLKPQFVRIFFNPQQDRAVKKSTRDSFVRSVQLAQSVGATINITVQSVGSYVDDPETGMKELASLLNDLVHSHAITNVHWVTLQNEPNTAGLTRITPPVLNAMYRALDKALLLRGLRSQIHFMAADLIEGGPLNQAHPNPSLPSTFNTLTADWTGFTNQAYWLTWIEHNMADIVDAYSIHIYWDAIADTPPNPLKFQNRLMSASRTGKPFYVTEFGVRGIRPPHAQGPGALPDGTPIEKSKVAAFQHAWFQIAAAKLKCAGTVKWDGYYAVYDGTPQSFYAIGEPVGDKWFCYPMYYLLWLFTNTTEHGWQPSGVPGVEPAWAALAEFRGPVSGLTIIGLDTRWATKNKNSKQESPYTLPTGLPRGTKLGFLVWNQKGGGHLVQLPAVTVGDGGVVGVKVPQHAVFALTTKALPQLPGDN